mmetsp:Transcript_8617/g.13348  ORF Transcript_8617/g.13348 Transcript_8617/m.13348 type:complete len:100 (-) Transcript_8617:600-899(-)|eukprot:CAMPEP_0170488388 /NCGR_PEP_ID=MMETSP0208-20121228/6942_1 /TAXON_ID=197538 /ORGANISM="Strombidium inclinatum, Strain S3" /LENGTH=99 /DNA_ID=CAMNT_0010762935 /DNA_START=2159 /DNA_END=2458 /DNA_ORIENTATION=+
MGNEKQMKQDPEAVKELLKDICGSMGIPDFNHFATICEMRSNSLGSDHPNTPQNEDGRLSLNSFSAELRKDEDEEKSKVDAGSPQKDKFSVLIANDEPL